MHGPIGEQLQLEALAIAFLTAGFSVWLDLSYPISGMVVGMVAVNRSRHHTRALHEIEHIQWPFMVLVFILAGASLDPSTLAKIGSTGIAYVVLRSLPRVLGGWIGAVLSCAPSSKRLWFGIALLPQAGIAVGMALVAGKQFPEWSETIMALTIGTTVAFEIFGPSATHFAVNKVQASVKPRRPL